MISWPTTRNTMKLTRELLVSTLYLLIMFGHVANKRHAKHTARLTGTVREACRRATEEGDVKCINNLMKILSTGRRVIPQGEMMSTRNQFFSDDLRVSGSLSTRNTMEKMAGLVQTHPAVEAALAKSEAAWEKLGAMLPGHDKADGCAADYDKVFRSEAAWKLIVNHDAVLRDLCNPSKSLNIIGNPLTQPSLQRVQPEYAEYADQALREVARRLLGPQMMTQQCEVQLASADQAKVWAQACAYMLARVQVHADEKPGRTQDMAPQAAGAFRAALSEVGTLGSR